LVIAALIGLARVVAGVHHLIDIIGSFVFAGIGVLVAGVVVEKLLKYRLDKSKSKP
jgi:membrane-associated phospholipid phosphatase